MLLWLGASAIPALWYGAVLCDAPPGRLKAWVKTAPLAILALGAFVVGQPWLALALGLSAVGDLSLSFDGTRAFLGGLVAFACAHLVYAAVLFGAAAGVPWAAIAVLAVLALSTPIWLLPYTRDFRGGDLKGPVAGYVAVISVMGAAAWAVPSLWVGLGATAFMVSDFLLALQLFRAVPHLSRPLWALYWGGQALLFVGLVQFL